MDRSLTRAVRRPLALLCGGLLTAAALAGPATPAVAAEAPTAAHWGNYQWNGGQLKAPVRAYWLFDRTGDPTMNAIIQWVADAWNGAREAHPGLPFTAVYKDNANVGQCFVNRTPGYSVASACMMPSLSAFGIDGISATHGEPHFIGGAFAISDGLSFNDAFTAVCHNFGHIMGLPDSDDEASCMNHNVAPGEIAWYGPGDIDALLALYDHEDGQAPVAVNDAYSTPEDVALTVNAPGVLANDTDVDGDTLTVTKVANPTNGAVTLNANGSFTYTPNANFNGTDTFTYKASGGGSDSNVGTVTVTVTAVADVPVAVADTHSINEDGVLNVASPGVLGNDTDPEGGLTAIKLSDPQHGTLTFNGDGSFIYTPAANYNGADSFTYKVNDGAADSNVATVTITVNPVNDAPTAVNDSYTATTAVPLVVSANNGLLANDTDVEGSALTAAKVSDPAHGTVTVNADGSFTYTAEVGFTGPDTFTYKSRDGSADSNVATVAITVQGVVPASGSRS